MSISRREFLKIGSAVGLTASLGSAAVNPLLGLVAPPADYPTPPEGIAMYGSRVRFQTFGLGLTTMTPPGYDSVIGKIVPGAMTLKKAGANAILIFGTSLTFYKGAAFNQKLIDDVKKATGLPASSMSSAVVDGLRQMGARRIAVATAYNDDVNGLLRTFLGESGFEVLALRGLGITAISEPSKVSQAICRNSAPASSPALGKPTLFSFLVAVCERSKFSNLWKGNVRSQSCRARLTRCGPEPGCWASMRRRKALVD